MLRQSVSVIACAALSATTTLHADDLLVCGWTSHNIVRYDGETGAFIDEFVASQSGGLRNPHAATIGPDGHLYVASFGTDEILRYDGQSGAFIDVFVPALTGGLDGPSDLTFGGVDGNLYITSFATSSVIRCDASTGSFIDEFVPTFSGGLDGAESLTFSEDGPLYVASNRTDNVKAYNGATGDYLGDVFAPGELGIDEPHYVLFGPDRRMYVPAFGSDQVLAYDFNGRGASVFVDPGSGGLEDAHGAAFGPDGNFYQSSFGTGEILRYDGTTGDFIDTFVTQNLGGVVNPIHVLFVEDIGMVLRGPVPGRAGEVNTLTVTGAPPGERVLFAFGFTPGSAPVPDCPDLFVDITNPDLAGVAFADANGVAALNAFVPRQASGRRVLVQAVERLNCTASNPVDITFP